MIKPGIGALAIFTFINSWNDCFMQLIMLSSTSKLTISLGIAKLRAENSTDYGLIMAGAALAAVPIIIVFLAFQKYFTKGHHDGALSRAKNPTAACGETRGFLGAAIARTRGAPKPEARCGNRKRVPLKAFPEEGVCNPDHRRMRQPADCPANGPCQQAPPSSVTFGDKLPQGKPTYSLRTGVFVYEDINKYRGIIPPSTPATHRTALSPPRASRH